jgi:MFS superfamily sulfate permease-like transporter
VPTASDEPTATATVDEPPQFPYPWLRQPAKVVVKADLLPALSLLGLIPLLGMGIAWLWARLAPPQRMTFVDGGPVPLPVESYHRFDDLAVFAVLCLGVGVVTGVGAWFLRERRGPVIMIAVVLGSVIGAWLAIKTGVSWAEGRYPVPGSPKLGDIFDKAPRLESQWAILTWPLTTALAYGALAAWNGRDDLGRRLD